jgi:hypothetical protein
MSTSEAITFNNISPYSNGNFPSFMTWYGFLRSPRMMCDVGWLVATDVSRTKYLANFQTSSSYQRTHDAWKRRSVFTRRLAVTLICAELSFVTFYCEQRTGKSKIRGEEISMRALWIKPTDALSSNFIVGNNNSTCFGQSFCPSSGGSRPYNGIGTIYAARLPSATRIRTECRCTAEKLLMMGRKTARNM